ncbi:hypothetical protein BDN71DRAFT_1524660 [Pleurotus eryngii]|uniref:CxC2-like cysteine cluster KDZ transposase-associated domain-containing protein n=1 Tax=Pleurotus eryngii TaxID=5323 RepID=A0A9P6DBZ5_PLEER|nr:hypothetical protein BDN71DRAFT_1524660 [Pleurotus eryngii]
MKWEKRIEVAWTSPEVYRQVQASPKQVQSAGRLRSHWTQPLLPRLTNALIEWKNTLPMDQSSAEDEMTAGESFNIIAINLYTLNHAATIHRAPDTEAAVALALTLAISLKRLELYRCLCLCKPSFSYKAFTKVLCDLYNVPYRHCWCNALANTYDIYLLMQHAIDKRVILNACPPCGYEVILDGNNSLKQITCIGQHDIADHRVYTHSDYFLPRNFVNTFTVKDPSRMEPEGGQSDPEDSQEHEDVTVEYHVDSMCADNWKATFSNRRKHMWELFDETGVFTCTCQHGFVLWLADMVRSGELLKTMIASSMLAVQAQSQSLHFCINTFHGYSHSYSCQVKNHPDIILGMGLEVLETLEHVFSSSNQLATVVRYSSAYRCHLAIDSFFQQWDEDKYCNLGTMILNNYKQALHILQEESLPLEEAKRTLGIQPGDLEKWQEEEAVYVTELGWESDADVLAVLDELDTLHNMISLKVKLNIPEGECWHTDHPRYHNTVKYISQHRYHCTIDKLHKLVVQQLFELHKMNLLATGYHMCTIQCALQDYNKAASLLSPPRPSLEWSEVSHYSFLDEFTLLHENRKDILSKPWAHPVVSCRLLTFILDEHDLFDTVEKSMEGSRDPLLVTVQEHCICRRCINLQLLTCISQIHALNGFTRECSYGTAKGLITTRELEVCEYLE